MDIELIKWVIQQSIGLAAAVGVFWIYRRDVHQALNSWRDQTRILTDLVATSTAAMQANTDAVRAVTDAVRAMETQLPHACPMADQLADDAVAAAARDTLRRVR
jgi:hypothetical protein